ncbi:radial spoke head protein 9 homolog [Tribolium castaneum]|uniref:Radial spoke head protein 9 homolog n=1 Tax=Tribolium castaneum TaxID=7070 RepID=D2A236_TRICA|nr:PREDICTED: radial spoke head protein 9 homolog [Tribolium castaneum]EFA02731.1 Radial spoke head protein 9 homolog-like Protein [Tribolium castaneum]|eukprot:XP_973627.1 PREDICTED: radial spoke head protein 9 homolog [Tribolium castaneum]
MNLNEVLDSLHVSEQSGHVISTEEGIILHNSLLILQNENHFRKIFFWGRICGTDNDYYVVYGYRSDALHDRIFYYSTNCLNWGLLPKPKDYALKLTPLCTARFQGDPALVLDVLLEKDEISFGDPLPEPQVKKLKEEDRLSATVHLINQEVAVVPRGALYKRTDGVIVENRAFEGLTPLEARELKSFLHFRQPTRKWNTNLLTRDDYNYAIDFLDPLDVDIPEGCWLQNFTAGEEMVVLKSLYWPGMVFFHEIKTPKYGFVYFGTGIKCLDVPFFLNGLYPVYEDFFQGK